ncbi:uncharacterized protein EURHEDRAFT_522177 [Aspergillus ruber CBS 135680]|uniref:Uncharacterized protein n=1 Tax=Aspergillus ruber (strain CBS 135680) TaxID=1388766 RepID=A0A017SI55_ASPRC|nr:uncharacterized protein EURHEDRAFT_522177 [Aspergillus ruber CBS 135680]EYE96436.1 hypothetical protein EURHEDRAFT_522177 [Aspergillus ruber CBS 135680]
MRFLYSRLPVHKPDTGRDEEGEDSPEQALELPRFFCRWLPMFLILLVLTNAITLLGSLYWASLRELRMKAEPPLDYAQIPQSLDTVWRRFRWNETGHSTAGRNEHIDAIWRNIRPSHGYITINRDLAKQRQWPESMGLLSNPEKGRVIRDTFWEAVERNPYTDSPGPHLDYCFDTLRQYIQCNADSIPLYTLGGIAAGDDQLHRCKDWSQLRDYATRHTACIRDVPEDVPISERFGICDMGKDGIVDLAE